MTVPTHEIQPRIGDTSSGIAFDTTLLSFRGSDGLNAVENVLGGLNAGLFAGRRPLLGVYLDNKQTLPLPILEKPLTRYVNVPYPVAAMRLLLLCTASSPLIVHPPVYLAMFLHTANMPAHPFALATTQTILKYGQTCDWQLVSGRVYDIFVSMRDVRQCLNGLYDVYTLLPFREWVMVSQMSLYLCWYNSVFALLANNNAKFGSMHEKVLPTRHLLIDWVMCACTVGAHSRDVFVYLNPNPKPLWLGTLLRHYEP